MAFSVTVPTADASITSAGGGRMVMGSITTSLASNTGTFDAGSTEIYVGGTLTINDSSAATFGTYTASFPVAIAYN